VACHISFRDVSFTPAATSVTISVVTDVPSHLWVRLSSKQPWIHKKPSIRRGVAFAEDVRFCFTVYDDNEQLEPGDTLEHTFLKPDWPVCTTKWFYIWGSIAGDTCVSTTAPFNYHNSYVRPPPRPIYVGDSPDPRAHFCATGYSFMSMNLPATGTGTITLIRIYKGTSTIHTFYIGFLYPTGDNRFTCRSAVYLVTDGSAGPKQFNVSMPIVAGDTIAWYTTNVRFYQDLLGIRPGRRSVSAYDNCCVVGKETYFLDLANIRTSIRGYGST